MTLRSLRSLLVGLPIVSLAALGLGVSAQTGCAPTTDDDGIQEDQGALCASGYGYGPCGKKHGYGYGYGYGYGIRP